MDQFESFETKRFVQRLLGKGDVSGLMDKIQVWGRCGLMKGKVGNHYPPGTLVPLKCPQAIRTFLKRWFSLPLFPNRMSSLRISSPS